MFYEYEFMAIESDAAVLGAQTAAHNMVNLETARRPHLPPPQFGPASSASTSRASACAPSVMRSSSPRARSRISAFAAAFGKNGRIVGAITFNHGKWLEYYGRLIEQSAPFPPPPPGYDEPANAEPMSARFPDPRETTGIPDVVLTGHDPNSRGAEFRPKAR